MLVDVLLLLMITSTKVVVYVVPYVIIMWQSMQDLIFGNDHSFSTNQCGQVTTISEQAVILTLLYYFPLVMLIILVVTKLIMKSEVIRLVVSAVVLLYAKI